MSACHNAEVLAQVGPPPPPLGYACIPPGYVPHTLLPTYTFPAPIRLDFLINEPTCEGANGTVQEGVRDSVHSLQ